MTARENYRKNTNVQANLTVLDFKIIIILNETYVYIIWNDSVTKLTNNIDAYLMRIFK